MGKEKKKQTLENGKLTVKLKSWQNWTTVNCTKISVLTFVSFWNAIKNFNIYLKYLYSASQYNKLIDFGDFATFVFYACKNIHDVWCVFI